MRSVLEFGEPVYKGGARIPLSDAAKKRVSLEFVPIELRLEKTRSDFTVRAKSDYDERKSRVLAMKVTAPNQKSVTLILRSQDFSKIRKGVTKSDLKSAISSIETWLEHGRQPQASVLTEVFSQILHGFVSGKAFKVGYDPSRLRKLEKKCEEDVPESLREIQLRDHGFSGEAQDRLDLSAAINYEEKQRSLSQNRRSWNLARNQISIAEIAAKTSKDELEKHQQKISEFGIIANAQESQRWKVLKKKHLELEETRRKNREYKKSLSEAVEANKISARLHARAKREKVRHVRKMGLMKRTVFPFKHSESWQKGPSLGEGPIPVRRIALARTTASRRTNQGGLSSSSNISQKERVLKAFDLIRRLARTLDEHYLDFDRAFKRFDLSSRGFVCRTEFERMFIPLKLREEDFNLLWNHFDRKKTGLVEKADLVWGFYNKRTLTEEVEKVEEHQLFKAEFVTKKITNAASGTSIDVSVEEICRLEHVPKDFEVVCISSLVRLCREDGVDTLVIFDERKTEKIVLSSVKDHKRFSRASWADEDGMVTLRTKGEDISSAQLLIEVFAFPNGCENEEQTIFLGEVLVPLQHFLIGSARVCALRNGDHEGSLRLKVRERVSKSNEANVERDFEPERAGARTVIHSLLKNLEHHETYNDAEEREEEQKHDQDDLISDRIQARELLFDILKTR